MRNQKGFSVVSVAIIAVVVVLIGLTGWLVMRANDDPTSNGVTNDLPVVPPQSYDAAKGNSIADFDKAPETLKASLVNDFYEEARATCEKSDKDETIYMTVKKVVREDFALVAYCGTDSDKVLANVSDNWRRVASADKEGRAPCEDIDRFKISRELADQCVLADGKLRDVTYP